MGVAKDERSALCDLFDQLGPAEPTLCEGWLTRDLAAHLVVRERRPAAAAGILIKPLAGYTKRVQDTYAAKPWPELVELVRSGPPAYWPTAIGAVDDAVNTAEFFVHHEDARRGQSGWEPRPPEATRDAALWTTLSRAGRMLLRRSPVGVVLRRETCLSGSSHQDRGADVTAKRGPNTVIISGEPGELLLFAFGRDAVRVDFDGEQSSIGVVQGLTRGL
jgi:uncharacterized protein (TIGR03085 family)